MSGGSMDYLFEKVRSARFALSTPDRRAFREHLDKVAAALRAIEWVDSGDAARGSEEIEIAACIGDSAALSQALLDAYAAEQALQRKIECAERMFLA